MTDAESLSAAFALPSDIGAALFNIVAASADQSGAGKDCDVRVRGVTLAQLVVLQVRGGKGVMNHRVPSCTG